MKKIIFLLLVAALSALVFAQADTRHSAVLTSFRQLSENEIEASFTLTNPYPFPEGLLRLSHDASALEVAQGKGWQCAVENIRERCLKPVRVIGSDQVTVNLLLKKYFPGEFIYVAYEVPEANNSRVDNQFLVTHTRNPYEISASTISLVAVVLLLLGLASWALALKARELQIGEGLLAALASVGDANHLLLAVLSSATLSLGLMLFVTPQFTVASAAIFALSFAFSFLLLGHFRHMEAEARERGPLTLADVSAEKARVSELVRATRVKYMKKQIDDATFKKLIADFELELLKIEDRGKQLAARQAAQQQAPQSKQQQEQRQNRQQTQSEQQEEQQKKENGQ